MHKKILLILAALGLISSVARAGTANHTRSASFLVGQTVVHTNVPAYGAEYNMPQQLNNWSFHPGMEKMHAQEYWEITGEGTDVDGDYVICNTRKSDSYGSSFFDGASYRLYRENLGTGEITKIREGTIPTNGFVAAGYMTLGTGLSPSAPTTDATDQHFVNNGDTWYYAVQARDVDGNWSGYSAPISGVTAQSGLSNGARINTTSLANPTVSQTYTTGSPFTTLTALGGTLPLSWSISSGALPSGMTLGSDGKIYGTAASGASATFTIRVTDSSAPAKTHDRTFAMFRATPTSDGLTPDAPTNVVVEAHDGFIHIQWDAPTNTDISSYHVRRSWAPASNHHERIYLGGVGPAPAANDMLFVELQTLNPPPFKTRSLRVYQYQQGISDWIAPYGIEQTQEVIAHPGLLPTAFQDEFPGDSCLKITSTQSNSFGVFRGVYGGTPDRFWRVGQLLPGHTYRMECWVYGDGLADDVLRFHLPEYTDQLVTGIVDSVWTKLAVEFTVTNWITNLISVAGPTYRFNGPGTAYIDNAQLYDINDPQGPGHYSQHVFDLWRDYVGPTNTTDKGVMRIRYSKEPFSSVMNPAVKTELRWYRVIGPRPTDSLHIHDALSIALATGTNAATRTIPWIIGNIRWSEDQYVDLIEYLAGPAGTTYGDLRIQQRGGETNTWTSAFRKIYIEMGNEPWNSSNYFVFRGGFSGESGTTYGRWSNFIWDYVWNNSSYMSDTIKPVLGGWNAARSTNSFTANAIREGTRSAHLGMTTYIGGWEAGQEGQIGGTTWSDDGLQQWPVFLDRSARDVVDSSIDLQKTLAAEGRDFDWLVYEAGPSYLQDGLNHVSLTPEEQDTSRRYGRTLAAGIGSLDYHMYAAYRNVKEVAFFGFTAERGQWASHNFIQDGHLPHPSFLVHTLYNNHISPASMLFTTPLGMPTFDLEYDKNGSIVLAPDMELASVYAFQNGSRYSVLFLNKKVDGVHNNYDFGDGSMSASVQLPFTNPSAITLYKISGDPRETNMLVENFQIVTQSVSTASFSQNFVVDDTNGGVTNGLPVGAIFLYVFEGATADTLPANPQVHVNQGPKQDDPQDGSLLNEIRFVVVFDRPVTGFDSASDVTVSGGVTPQSITINEITGSFGMSYEVVLNTLDVEGAVTLSVPAAAAQAVDTSNDNDPSTALDATVTIQFSSGLSLVQWEFIDLDDFPANAVQNPTNTAYHARMKSSVISTGSLATPYPSNKWHNNDAYSYTGPATNTALNPDEYLSWIVAPTNGWKLSLSQIKLGACTTANGDDFFVELRWSTDSFSTHNTVTLTPANPLIGGTYISTTGTPLEGDLSAFSGLQNTTNAVQFRFYIWGISNHSQSRGIGKIGDDVIDLMVRGSVAQASGSTRYVDPTHPSASDFNSGSSFFPWVTIQNAAQTVLPGDTVIVSPGIYRETISFANAGTDGLPITLKASDPNDRPIIDGSVILPTWSGPDAQGIYTHSVTSTPPMVFEDDVRLALAMNPDVVNTNDVYNHTAWYTVSSNAVLTPGSGEEQTMLNANIEYLFLDATFTTVNGQAVGDDYWNGATLYHHNRAQNRTLLHDVIDYDAGLNRITMTLLSLSQNERILQPSAGGAQTDYYALANHIGVLDAPGEFATSGNTLYVKPLQGGAPGVIAISSLENGFEIQKAHITIDGFEIRRFTQDGIYDTYSYQPDNFTLLNSTIYHNNRHGLTLQKAKNILIKDSQFSLNDTDGINISSDIGNVELDNVYVHHNNDNGLWMGSGVLTTYAATNILIQNSRFIFNESAKSHPDNLQFHQVGHVTIDNCLIQQGPDKHQNMWCQQTGYFKMQRTKVISGPIGMNAMSPATFYNNVFDDVTMRFDAHQGTLGEWAVTVANIDGVWQAWKYLRDDIQGNIATYPLNLLWNTSLPFVQTIRAWPPNTEITDPNMKTDIVNHINAIIQDNDLLKNHPEIQPNLNPNLAAKHIIDALLEGGTILANGEIAHALNTAEQEDISGLNRVILEEETLQNRVNKSLHSYRPRKVTFVNNVFIEGSVTDPPDVLNLNANFVGHHNYYHVTTPFFHDGITNLFGIGSTDIDDLTVDGLTNEFVNYSTQDFHLKSGSSLIDAGVNVGLPFAGVAPDMGRYEVGPNQGPAVSISADIPLLPLTEIETYRISVVNGGPGTASGVQAINTFSASANILSHNAGSAYTPATGTWTLGDLTNGASKELMLQVSFNQAGLVTNSVIITASASDAMLPGNDNDSATIEIAGNAAITDIIASTSMNTATVQWNSVTGRTYNLYYTDNGFKKIPTWYRGTQVTATTPLSSFTDNAVTTNLMRRFFQIVPEGGHPSTNGIWGLVRKNIPQGYSMFATPLDIDRHLDNTLGLELASALTGHASGPGDGLGDELHILESGGSWRTLYLDASNIWRESNGSASTYEVPPGRGLFILRNSPTTSKVTFVGPSGNKGSRTTTIQAGWNILGLSEGPSLDVQSTFPSGDLIGAAAEENADMIAVRSPDGSWRRLIYIQGWGAPYDGNWFDMQTFSVSDFELEPGDALYFYRQTSGGDMNVNF